MLETPNSLYQGVCQGVHALLNLGLAAPNEKRASRRVL